MLRHYYRQFILRNFNRNRSLTLLNTFGLAVGFTAFILITLFVQHEKQYDTFHRHYNDIYRIIKESKGKLYGGSPAQLGPFLKERIPEVDDYVRLHQRKDFLVEHQGELFFEKDLLYADPSLFDVFDFRVVSGDTEGLLEDPGSLILTQTMARKYFGDEDPIGQTLWLFKDKRPFTVRAIAADAPDESTIRFNVIIPFEPLARRSIWYMFNYTTFLKLDHTLEQQASSKMSGLAFDLKDRRIELDFIRLQPLQSLRFDPVIGNDFPVTEKKYLLIYLSAAIFVLILAVINYSNLASALAVKRSREVALKKISGSSRRRLMTEVMGESILISVLALFVAVIFVECLRPYFIDVIGKPLHFDYSGLPVYLSISLLTGIMAGLYPASYISGFGVMSLLKGSVYRGHKGSSFRNVLVLIQFGITSLLLICALSITRQLHYLTHQDLGINTDRVYNLQVHWPGVKVKELKQALQRSPLIANVSTSSFGAGLNNWNQTTYWPGSTEQERIQMDVHCVDTDFFETLGIELLEGADTYRDHRRRDSSLFVLSASAKKHIGWSRATGKQFGVFGPGVYGDVAGVVPDLMFRSLHHQMNPSAYVLVDGPLHDKMQIRFREGNLSEARRLVRRQWEIFAPANAPCMLTSLEQDFENLYGEEERTRTILTAFTVFAMLISFFGLFGLATYMSLQRTREMGVRKVVGATSRGLIGLLVGSFVKWVALAYVLAIPLAYIYVSGWLQNFAYRMDLLDLAGVFVLSGLFAMGVGVTGVILQAWKASVTNPVDSLRYE